MWISTRSRNKLDKVLMGTLRSGLVRSSSESFRANVCRLPRFPSYLSSGASSLALIRKLEKLLR